MGCADAGWDALGQRSATTTCRALQPSMQPGPAFHTPARDAAASAAGGTTREPETGLMVRREWMRPSEFEISCRNELYGRSPRFRNPLNPPGAEERLAGGSTQPLLPRRGARRQDHRRGVPPTVRPALLHERTRTRRSGGPAGIRTPDLCRARAALSQLSYRPLGCLSVTTPRERARRRPSSAGPPLPAGLLEHLLVLVAAHLLAPLLDDRAHVLSLPAGEGPGAAPGALVNPCQRGDYTSAGPPGLTEPVGGRGLGGPRAAARRWPRGARGAP